MSNNKFKILVIEDEINICSFLETLLSANGYQTMTAINCVTGNSLFMSYNPDLVILDLGLPDKDGLEFIKAIRKTFITPIIVLSARTAETDKVAALDLGANDYMTKPFGTAELIARIRATLRSSRHGTASGALPGGKFKAGGLTIDYERRRVFVNGREIKLTQTEYNIVVLLSEQSGRVMTYATIVRTIWGGTDYSSTKKLQVNIANIRKKFGSKPGDNPYIQNELGIGYRMIEEDAEKTQV